MLACGVQRQWTHWYFKDGRFSAKLPADDLRLVGANDTRMRLKKSMYGLSHAPRSWQVSAARNGKTEFASVDDPFGIGDPTPKPRRLSSCASCRSAEKPRCVGGTFGVSGLVSSEAARHQLRIRVLDISVP